MYHLVAIRDLLGMVLDVLRKLLALPLALSCAVVVALPAETEAVVNAERRVTKTSEAPWAVQVWVADGDGGRSLTCSGTLIDELWVLTAAHCLDFIDPEYEHFEVVAASAAGRPSSEGVGYYHAQYIDYLFTNDIGLIRLNSALPGVKTLPIAPKSDKKIMKRTLRVYGWGLTERGTSGVLLTTRQKLDTRAGRHWPYFSSRNQVATRWYSKGKWRGTCSGDSGGPLIGSSGGRKYVVGVVSYGAASCNPRYAAVYARVSAYREWLTTTMASVDSVANIPDAPQRLTATPGKSQVTLSWPAPVRTGRGPLTGYRVEMWSGTNAAAVVLETPATTAVIPNLENGTRYWFRVSVLNGFGVSQWSPSASAVPGIQRATAPRSLRVSADGSKLRVQWLAPSFTDAEPIIHYEVRVGGNTYTTTNTSFTTPDLRRGNTYSVRIFAVTAAGAGAEETGSLYLETVLAPSAPRSLTVNIEGTTARVNWIVPASMYGDAVLQYHVYAEGGGVTRQVLSTTTSAELTGLAPGSSTTFSVRAETASSMGAAASTTASISPAPGTPVVTLDFGHDSAGVSWTQPVVAGSFPVTGYLIEYRVSAGQWVSLQVGADKRSAELTGLSPATRYEVRVSAVSAWTSSTSIVAAGSTQASPVPVVAATAARSGGVVDVSWSSSIEVGVLEFQIQTAADPEFSAPVVSVVSGASRSSSVSTTTAGFVRVRGRNATGWGRWSSTASYPAQT
jgi:hypothetical protein